MAYLLTRPRQTRPLKNKIFICKKSGKIQAKFFIQFLDELDNFKHFELYLFFSPYLAENRQYGKKPKYSSKYLELSNLKLNKKFLHIYFWIFPLFLHLEILFLHDFTSRRHVSTWWNTSSPRFIKILEVRIQTRGVLLYDTNIVKKNLTLIVQNFFA